MMKQKTLVAILMAKIMKANPNIQKHRMSSKIAFSRQNNNYSQTWPPFPDKHIHKFVLL